MGRNSIAVALVAVGLVGCAEVNTQAELAAACRGYAGALTVAADTYQRLNTSERQTIESARQIATPVCADLDGTENPTDALRQVRDATRKLNEVTP